LLQTAQDLEEYADKAQVQKRVALSQSILQDKIANVRGAVIMAYPMGLPEWDLVKLSLDSDDLEVSTLVQIHLTIPFQFKPCSHNSSISQGNVCIQRAT